MRKKRTEMEELCVSGCLLYGKAVQSVNRSQDSPKHFRTSVRRFIWSVSGAWIRRKDDLAAPLYIRMGLCEVAGNTLIGYCGYCWGY